MITSCPLPRCSRPFLPVCVRPLWKARETLETVAALKELADALQRSRKKADQVRTR